MHDMPLCTLSILCARTCTYQCTHGCYSTHAQEQREWQHARQSVALTQQSAATSSKSSKLLGVGATAEEAGALRLEVCRVQYARGRGSRANPNSNPNPPTLTLTLTVHSNTRTPQPLLYCPLGEAARVGDRSARAGNCASERRAAAARGRGAGYISCRIYRRRRGHRKCPNPNPNPNPASPITL